MAFFIFPGSRLERAEKGLALIGPAVINGATTTFLAVILLCDSKSYAMLQFFKVFFLVVVFGLYHAVIFLPVLLRVDPSSIMSCKSVSKKYEVPDHEHRIHVWFMLKCA